MGIDALSFPALLIFAVLLPVVAEVAKNLGGILLASRPQFDDMVDGLTFGIAAGTAYAAFETIVLYSSVFTSPDFRTTDGLASWAVVVVNLMVVKSLIYGTATGIAVAAYSGKGEKYDGFTPSYFMAFGLAVAANVGYWLGVRLLSYVPFGQALGLLWGFVILAVLVLRIRTTMQAALLEAAVEDAVRQDGGTSKRATAVETYCPECENQLLGRLELLHGLRHVRAHHQPPGPANDELADRGRCAHDDHASEPPEQQPDQQSGPPAYAPAPAAYEPAAPSRPGTPGGNFRSGRGKTIGLIVAGVVAVGALGAPRCRGLRR